MARLIGLDPGERRVGVAVSDELGMLARPVEVLERTSWARDLDRLADLIREYQPGALVVGYPLPASGQPTSQTLAAERFARRLEERFSLPIYRWNESYSSVEARRRRAMAPAGRKRSRWIDAEAAAIILQDYLDQHACSTPSSAAC
jgi:putative Holliday junction resolvase